ncbi:hypothetical protein VSR68_40940 [Paraburkholderia phymatum]|uniref:hypothetical protein n=2 Tax=Paraburkholderia TaxID=1822464 RepID=UPI003179480D
MQLDAALARNHFGGRRVANILPDGAMRKSEYRSEGDEFFRVHIANSCYRYRTHLLEKLEFRESASPLFRHL